MLWVLIEDEFGQKKRVFLDVVFYCVKKVCGIMMCSSNVVVVYNKLQEIDIEVKLFVVIDVNNYEYFKSYVFKM